MFVVNKLHQLLPLLSLLYNIHNSYASLYFFFLRLTVLLYISIFGRAVGAEVDVPFFLSDNVRIFDYTGKRQIRAVNELLELKTTYPVDQKTKDRKVLPGLNLATKGFHISLFIWPAERVGNVDPDIASEAGHFSKVIHFLSRRAGHDELIELGRRIRQNILDVKIGTANFAIRLNRQNTAQKILIFRVLLVKIF